MAATRIDWVREHCRLLRAISAEFARTRPFAGLIGGTEETTSGRMRLEPLRGELRRPVLVINDSPIKQFAENEHAVGQSSLECPGRPHHHRHRRP